MRFTWALILILLWCGDREMRAAAPVGSWTSLFNGRDLSGWHRVNCAPETFSVRDEMIVSTGVPTGVLRSDRQYENFELELEYRHMKPGGNAGLFVWSDPITSPGVPFARAIEVQILDGLNTDNYTSHGDLFAIHGATFKPDRPHPNGWMRCLPSERRARPAGEWNHYHVLCSNGVVRLAVNGKVVSGGFDSRPRKGYICLESEGSECHFRNLRLRELPSTHPKPDEIAPRAEPFESIYTGLDLRGWRTTPGHVTGWSAKDWVLEFNGRAEGTNQQLWTTREFRDFVLMVDWRLSNPTNVLDSGEMGIALRGSPTAVVNLGRNPVGSGGVWSYQSDPKHPSDVRAGATPRLRADKPAGEWNRFFITLRGDRLTVQLNGQTVLEKSRMPGLPRRGAIGLQPQGSAIQFANLFVQDLK